MSLNSVSRITTNGLSTRRFPPAWREAAVFGALWGAGEITLGAFLTAIRIPMTGVFMACFGIIILISGQMLIKRRWFPLRTALVCAGLRSLSPGGVIFGPMFAIILQGLIVSLVFYILHKPLIAGVVSGFIATITSILQGIVVKLIVYGATLWDIYLSLLSKAESILHLHAGQGWIIVGLFFVLVGSLGAGAGVFGWRLGSAAIRKKEILRG